MPRRRHAITLTVLGLGACAADPTPAAPERPAPSDETELSRADDVDARGPAEIVERYYALLNAADYAAAQALWRSETDKGRESTDDFARSMAPYQSVAVTVTGEPRIEGSAGSLYATVPVRLDIVRRGAPLTSDGDVVLRRCDDVPGCTGADRAWRLHAIELAP